MRRRSSLLAVVVAIVVLLAACDPVAHTVHTEVAPASSGLKVLSVSADARYVVVESAGTDAVAPGAGTWRIDRTDGTAVAVPTGSMSSDGQRILAGEFPGTGYRSLWVDGVVKAGPDDIPSGTGSLSFRWASGFRFAMYYDYAGVLKRWDPLTRTSTPIDVGVRPPGATGGASTGALSADGTVVLVSYSDGICNPFQRVVDLDTGTTTDITGECFEGYSLSTDGSTLIRTDPSPRTEVTLIDTATGAEGQLYTTPPGSEIETVLASADGQTAWVSQVREEEVACGPTGPCTVIVERQLVAVRRRGHKVFPAAPGDRTRLTTDPSGRFLAYSTSEGLDGDVDELHPVQVVDWITGTVETLAVPGSSEVTSHPFLTKGGNLVITGTEAGGLGWHEFAAPPQGG